MRVPLLTSTNILSESKHIDNVAVDISLNSTALIRVFEIAITTKFDDSFVCRRHHCAQNCWLTFIESVIVWLLLHCMPSLRSWIWQLFRADAALMDVTTKSKANPSQNDKIQRLDTPSRKVGVDSAAANSCLSGMEWFSRPLSLYLFMMLLLGDRASKSKDFASDKRGQDPGGPLWWTSGCAYGAPLGSLKNAELQWCPQRRQWDHMQLLHCGLRLIWGRSATSRTSSVCSRRPSPRPRPSRSSFSFSISISISTPSPSPLLSSSCPCGWTTSFSS